MPHKKKPRKGRLLLIAVILLVSIMFFVNKSRMTLDSYVGSIGDNKNESDPFADSRLQMVETQLAKRDIDDENVLVVMGRVERHLFVPSYLRGKAYGDHPLPIGNGQTISQPYIVALMTQHLDVDEDDRVLEVGTGSGYQAAVLGELVKEVYTIEIIEELAKSAEERLKNLGYDNVVVKHGDGYYGWEEHAPFDIIVVTAAANHIPPPLLQQLKDGGRLVLPLGSTHAFQTLTLVMKKGDQVKTKYITGVRFVPFVGKAQERQS